MKKIALPVLATVLAFGSMNAQERPYNKWSVDLNAGLTKPTEPFTSGYFADTFGFIHADGGVRYMFNNKFGVKADFGYDKIENADDSKKFETQYYRTSLQGVVNLGRVFNFEEWTKVLNIQAHAGAGYSWMTSDGFKGTDQMANVMAGITGQLKLSERVALNADFTMIKNAQQNHSYDGYTDVSSARGLQGNLYNATLGLSIYLGAHGTHADWYYGDSSTNKLAELDNRLTDVENKMMDSDNDGVADYLDQEPNTPAGAMVDVKGRSIDKNNNGIPDSFESYLEEKYGKQKVETMTVEDSALVKELINKGYVAVYFDFNKSQPTAASTEGMNFIVTYLRSNPSSSVEVIGYADAVGGNSNYNKQLSEKRATAVKNILEKSGVAASKISVKGNGIDDSVEKSSNKAREIARRVVFKVK
ncbi:OmpA family protein [Flavobacterium sp. NKUCC04_CG]|uniref:OmpA family protein n=1 Tax=Flavobacterium sp. NKUCC04_CG TaxID=2842121 RepID=UPI001C5B4003|nr:OmpA family protein [Flavobacterium sp. NKUCC04_CG]MBW3518695.1 OmpA family protein [Flavobacterium sp. NKUCC04_CG]